MAFFMEFELHELEFHAIFFFFISFTYNCVSWRPMLAFLWNSSSMNLSSMQFFFFLSLITPYPIFYKLSFTLKLDFEKIELQKRGISLISLKNGTKGCIICAKRALAQIPLLRMGCKFSNNLRILSTNILNFTINVLRSYKI